MKKILVPTDFSKVANNALDEAVNIAKRTSSEIVLLHVIEGGPTSGSIHITGEYQADDPQEQIYMLKLIERSKEQLEALGGAYEGVDITTQLRMGNPYHGITDIVNDQDVDMIVMGTTGSSGIEELLIGSNAEKIVRHAKCPVMTVNQKTGKTSCENIVLATGMSEKENDLVGVLKDLQAQYNSTIHLLWVNTPNNFERDRNTKVRLEDYAQSHGLTNYTINIFNDVTEEEGIVCFARDMDADLIAMVTHRRTGIAHLIAGSIAEDVVNHSKRPVLTSGVN